MATFAIGRAGAINAALFAVAQLAVAGDADIASRLRDFRTAQREKIESTVLPLLESKSEQES